jgi:hypothetical protein
MAIVVSFVKKDGTLQMSDKMQKAIYDQFKGQIAEGQKIEAFFDITLDDGSLAQLAKVHAMVRDLAIHTGNSFDNMKLLVKDQAGLCVTREIEGKEFFHCKSFGECSRNELALAIEACNELAEKTGYSFSM